MKGAVTLDKNLSATAFLAVSLTFGQILQIFEIYMGLC
jgi:hypothetical protein